MPTEEESWTKKWKHQNWNGLTAKKIAVKKAAYKKKAIASIEKQINMLYKKALKSNKKAKKIKYRLEWAQEPIYYLNTWITVAPPPPPQPGQLFSKLGSTNPQPPPQPK
jgi:hypothetical protein